MNDFSHVFPALSMTKNIKQLDTVNRFLIPEKTYISYSDNMRVLKNPKENWIEQQKNYLQWEFMAILKKLPMII